MHCFAVFFLVSLVTIGVFCADWDWDAFQDWGYPSSDTTLAFSDAEELNPFITTSDSSSDFILDDVSPVTNQEDPFMIFDSGGMDATPDQPGSSNLLANADDNCSHAPSRRIRARADDEPSSCSSSSLSINPPSLTSDVFLDSLQIPRLGHKITDYENADQRLTGQAYCPSHQIMMPGLILPVCDSGTPDLNKAMSALDVLYIVMNGFLSTFFFLVDPLYPLSPFDRPPRGLLFHPPPPSSKN